MTENDRPDSILIIDDDVQFGAYLKELLSSEGYLTRWAQDGRSGLHLYVMTQPDLVLTDLIMPDVEGIELILALRAGNPCCPIIAMSGGRSSRSHDYLEMAAKLGASGILDKPFTAAALLEAVSRALGDALPAGGARP